MVRPRAACANRSDKPTARARREHVTRTRERARGRRHERCMRAIATRAWDACALHAMRDRDEAGSELDAH